TVTGMALTTAGLAAFAAVGTESMLIVALILAGAGLGLYIPANNAAVVAAAPAGHAGSASGMLNLSRGLGTALGVAVAALIYGLVAGTAASAAATAAQAGAGARVASTALALVALVAGLLAALRNERLGHPRVAAA
ncbi:MAG TPA: MFS transporter, partial [Candidatus Dormibacteraeota bacterium]